MDDTSVAASRRYFELLRARSTSQRASMLVGLNAAVRQLAEAGERSRHPEASELELKARVAARLYGRAVATRLFPLADIDR